MREKLIAFIGGFVFTLLIFIGAMYFFSIPEKVELPKIEELTDSHIVQIKQTTDNLDNYGDLPKEVNSGDVGRSNPFESY